MNNSDICNLELLEIGKQIHAGEITSLQVTQIILNRIEKLDTHLLSFVQVLKAQALLSAQQADKEIAAGLIRSPLHGVPFAIKDLFHMAGTVTSNGMTINHDNISTINATVVDRLLASGAVIIGKLKLTEAAFSDPHPNIPVPINP